MDERRVRTSCPGTCGEWVQGIYKGQPFLISAPVNRYVVVEVEKHCKGWRIPAHKYKVRQVLNNIAGQYRLDFGVEVRFLQELPCGKGMASSTADIVCTAGGVLALAGIEPVPERLAQLALTVEPSDSVMFPGLTVMNHLRDQNYRTLGKSVAAELLILDCGGMLDTQTFNHRHDLPAHYRKHQPAIRRAFSLFEEGIAHNDLEKMAAAATISAECNLEINPKPPFKDFLHWVKQQGGLGVISAHSGTLLTGVFSPGTRLQKILGEAQERLNVRFEVFQAVDGGIRIERMNGPCMEATCG